MSPTPRFAAIHALLAACFSSNGLAREKPVRFPQLACAVGEFQQRCPDVPWLIPVRLDDCQIPDWPVGGGRTLGSLQHADVLGEQEQETARLVTAVSRILAPPPGGEAA